MGIRHCMRSGFLFTEQLPVDHCQTTICLPSKTLPNKTDSKTIQVVSFVLPKSSEVLCIPHGRLQSSSEGHVHIEAHTCSSADLQHTQAHVKVTYVHCKM